MNKLMTFEAITSFSKDDSTSDGRLTFNSPAYLQKQLTNGHGHAAAILGNARSLAAGVAAREPVCEVECHAVLLGSPIRLTYIGGMVGAGGTCHHLQSSPGFHWSADTGWPSYWYVHCPSASRSDPPAQKKPGGGLCSNTMVARRSCADM